MTLQQPCFVLLKEPDVPPPPPSPALQPCQFCNTYECTACDSQLIQLGKFMTAEKAMTLMLTGERDCFSCKMTLPSSAYYNGNSIKYYICKNCEALRHRNTYKKQRPNSTDCPDCSKAMVPEVMPTNGVRKSRRTRFQCAPCGRIMDFKRRKNGS